MEMKDAVERHSHKEDNPPALLYTEGQENCGRGVEKRWRWRRGHGSYRGKEE